MAAIMNRPPAKVSKVVRTPADGWFYERSSERDPSDDPLNYQSGFTLQTIGESSLDERFTDLRKRFLETYELDIRTDNHMVKDKAFMAEYKEALMDPVFEAFREACPSDPHVEHTIRNASNFWDTKLKLINESASMMGFLPMATLEFPVLLKQFFQTIVKDIIEVESVKTPNITKHIRSTFMVNNQTGEELEYPKCLFDGTWEQMWRASKGHAIREDVVTLTDGRLHRYNVITGLTDGTPGLDTISFQFKIVGVQVTNGAGAAEVYRLKGNGITVEFSTNGTFVNGDLDFYLEDGTHIQDTIGGMVNFRQGTVDISTSNGVVSGVVFSGFLSNEKNLRHISVRERRDIVRITIEDGPRWNMPFSIEEITDAAALLDVNYYNRMVDEIVRTMEMQECMTVITFLNDEFEKYHGVTTDIYNLESLAHRYHVDIQPPPNFAGDPFKYVSSAVQFKLRAIFYQLTELSKLDNLSFVIAGNSMATQTLGEFAKWKVQSGTNIGGITVNNSYGFATDLGQANVRVVASNLYDAYTVDQVPNVDLLEYDANQRELILHIYGYPTTPEHISFRHLKFTSHLLTSQSQTAYQSPQAPGGAYNVVTATNRFHTFAIQGIQAQLVLLNSSYVYGQAFLRPPITGAPWRELPDFGAGDDPGAGTP